MKNHREGKLSNPRGARRAGCMHGENLQNPARDRRAGVMRQFPSCQLDSTHTYYIIITYTNFFAFHRYNPPLFRQDPYLSVQLPTILFSVVFFRPVLVDLPSFLQFFY